uniref:Uncharacterized protein n=1 Tax=Sphaerodactylus townsendi TaxID=933632 RepID=A0ACB8EK77_9SAUR
MASTLAPRQLYWYQGMAQEDAAPVFLSFDPLVIEYLKMFAPAERSAISRSMVLQSLSIAGSPGATEGGKPSLWVASKLLDGVPTPG